MTTRCSVCQGAVFQMERQDFQKLIFHKSCFKCSKCKSSLTVGTCNILNAAAYCKNCVQRARLAGAADSNPMIDKAADASAGRIGRGTSVSEPAVVALRPKTPPMATVTLRPTATATAAPSADAKTAAAAAATAQAAATAASLASKRLTGSLTLAELVAALRPSLYDAGAVTDKNVLHIVAEYCAGSVYLVTASTYVRTTQGTLLVWDMNAKPQPAVVFTVPTNHRIERMLRLKSGLIAAAGDGVVTLWNLESRQKVAHLKVTTEGRVQSLAEMPHPQRPYTSLLLTGTSDATLKVWDLDTYQALSRDGDGRHTAPPEEVLAVAGLPTGLMISGAEYMRVWQWTPTGGLERVGGRMLPPPRHLFVDDHGQLLTVDCSTTVRVYNSLDALTRARTFDILDDKAVPTLHRGTWGDGHLYPGADVVAKLTPPLLLPIPLVREPDPPVLPAADPYAPDAPEMGVPDAPAPPQPQPQPFLFPQPQLQLPYGAALRLANGPISPGGQLGVYVRPTVNPANGELGIAAGPKDGGVYRKVNPYYLTGAADGSTTGGGQLPPSAYHDEPPVATGGGQISLAGMLYPPTTGGGQTSPRAGPAGGAAPAVGAAGGAADGAALEVAPDVESEYETDDEADAAGPCVSAPPGWVRPKTKRKKKKANPLAATTSVNTAPPKPQPNATEVVGVPPAPNAYDLTDKLLAAPVAPPSPVADGGAQDAALAGALGRVRVMNRRAPGQPGFVSGFAGGARRWPAVAAPQPVVGRERARMWPAGVHAIAPNCEPDTAHRPRRFQQWLITSTQNSNALRVWDVSLAAAGTVPRLATSAERDDLTRAAPVRGLSAFDNAQAHDQTTVAPYVLANLAGHQSRVCALTCLPDGRVVSADRTGGLIVWRLADYTYDILQQSGSVSWDSADRIPIAVAGLHIDASATSHITASATASATATATAAAAADKGSAAGGPIPGGEVAAAVPKGPYQVDVMTWLVM